MSDSEKSSIYSEDENDENLYESDDDISIKDTENPALNDDEDLGMSDDDEDPDDSDDEDNTEIKLKKITPEMKTNIIEEHHPELKYRNHKEIEILSKVVRDISGRIIDPFHHTNPLISKYEIARLIGERAKQISNGVLPLVQSDSIDPYVLAELELREKKIPFIIQRPLPNGTCEYWRIEDLEFI
jgi:DNA-directed RNA polymerase subunit K/omega